MLEAFPSRMVNECKELDVQRLTPPGPLLLWKLQRVNFAVGKKGGRGGGGMYAEHYLFHVRWSCKASAHEWFLPPERERCKFMQLVSR